MTPPPDDKMQDARCFNPGPLSRGYPQAPEPACRCCRSRPLNPYIAASDPHVSLVALLLLVQLSSRSPSQIHTCLDNAPIDGTEQGGLALGETTLLETLRDLGYATHVVGKWHLGMASEEYLPTYRGADAFFGENRQF